MALQLYRSEVDADSVDWGLIQVDGDDVDERLFIMEGWTDGRVEDD